MLAARAFDLRLNGREFETHRPLALPGSDLGQVTHTYVPLSPSSITWHRCKSRGGNGRLWKRCGLPSTTPGASPLPGQDHGKIGNGDEHRTWRHIVCVCNYTDQWQLYLTLPYFTLPSGRTTPSGAIQHSDHQVGLLRIAVKPKAKKASRKL